MTLLSYIYPRAELLRALAECERLRHDIASAFELENKSKKETLELSEKLSHTESAVLILTKERDRLRAERATLIQAQQNATQAATDARQRCAEALERENAALTREGLAIKQVANYAVFASGSRFPIFPGVGPELPTPKYTTAPEPIQGRKRASEVASATSRNFLKEFTEEAAGPAIDVEAELNSIYEQANQ